MDGVKPLHRLLHQIYEGDAAWREAAGLRLLAESLTSQEFLERLSGQAFKSLLDGKHDRMRPGVEWLAKTLRVQERVGTGPPGRLPRTTRTDR
jgi:hypothetical protein